MQEVILTGTTYQQTPNSDNIWVFVHSILIHKTQKLLENRCQVASPKSVWHAETNTSIIQSDRSDLKCTGFSMLSVSRKKIASQPMVFASLTCTCTWSLLFLLCVFTSNTFKHLKYLFFVLVWIHIYWSHNMSQELTCDTVMTAKASWCSHGR